MATLPPKDPDELLDYRFDWAGRLEGDPIAGVEFQVSAGLDILDTEFDQTSASLWLQGGTAGETAKVTCRVRTATGRTLEHSAELPIRER